MSPLANADLWTPEAPNGRSVLTLDYATLSPPNLNQLTPGM